jgi:cyclic 2,3-diphosphoglycerate synthetase
MMRNVVLIDGEHYPPVTKSAVESIEQVEAAVFIGGTEKVGSIDELEEHLTIPIYRADGPLPDVIDKIIVICKNHQADQVIDLSDEPIVNYLSRFQIASVLMKEHIHYRGSDFYFSPPPSPKILKNPSLMVIGTTKRVGKTAISGYIARTLKKKDITPCIVTMGRGGPAQPEVIHGSQIDLSPSYLLQQVALGKHAASDHWENALISRVTTVGCRRCGGGMAGTPFTSNVVEGAHIANTLQADMVIMEGSGVTLPPVYTDAHVVIAGAHQPLSFFTSYFGPFRILLADIVMIMMCEEPLASPEKVDQIAKAIDKIHPGVLQAHCVFRPRPLLSIKGKSVALATTAPPDILTQKIVPYLEETYGCEVVGASPHLSHRQKMKKDLEQFLPQADTLLTEVKASAIDVATRMALDQGLDVVYMDNIPLMLGGNIENLDKAIITLAEEVST